MSFVDCHDKISDHVADRSFSLTMSGIVCINWLTLTFGCTWRLIRRSNVRCLGCRSDIKRLVRCSNVRCLGCHSDIRRLVWRSDIKHLGWRLDIRHGWPHMPKILSTWLDWLARLIGPIGLVCPFCLTLWKKENLSLMVSNEAYLGPNGVIPNRLYVCPGRPKALESKKDT